MRPALVISSFTMGLGVIRALGAGGVPVVVVKYDLGDMGHVSRHVREVVPAPHPATQEEAFVARLLELAPRYDRGLLVPASDASLVAISRHRAALEEHYVVAATGWDVTQRFIEKRETYALAEAAGVPAPKTTVPQSLEDAERYAEAALYPCLVKPSQGHLYKARFGTKMVRADDRDALVRAYREAADAGLEVMLQELIPGPDRNGANYNSYMWDGQPLVEFTARKLRGSPPELGSPRVARSELIPEVIEPGRAILRAMNFEGFSCTEFKRDERDGVWKLMEVNGRANLSGSLAVRCGVNFPLLQYRHLMDGELPKVERFETGVYWIDLIRDMGCNVRFREGYPLRELLEPYRRRHVFAIWDPSDPKPFLVRFANLARSAFSALRRRAGVGAGSAGA
jgi:predicted ATP-grasp superfamily ATP-dependent carboligase